MSAEHLRRGSPIAYWNATVVNAGDVSPAKQSGRGTNMFAFFVAADKTSSFQLQVAHDGALNADGTYPDPDAQSYVWHDAWYLGTTGLGNSTQILIGGTGAFNIASIVADMEWNWTRLKCVTGTTVTVTAGFEAWGD